METMGHSVGLYKPIFIACLHRTGSTLLKNMLDANSAVAMASDEMDLSNPWHKTFLDHLTHFGNLQDPSNLSNLVDFIYRADIRGSFWRQYQTFGIEKNRILERLRQSDCTPRSIVSVLLDEFRIREGGERVGVKFPVHFSRVELLHRWYPDCKTILLTRDPRAMCASKIGDESTTRRKAAFRPLAPFVHYGTLAFFAFEYVWCARVYSRLGRRLGMLKVRYEDLIMNTRRCLEDVCNFCELDFEESMLDATGKASSHVDATVRGVDRRALYRWRDRLRSVDVRLIAMITGRSMKCLGYAQIEEEYRKWAEESPACARP